MGYVKVSWPDSQKFTVLTDDEFEQYEEDGIIIFGSDDSYLIDEDYIDEIDAICNSRISGCGEDEPDFITLNSLLNSDSQEDIDRGTKIKDSLEKIATSLASSDGDIELKKELELPSRDDNVYGFYVYKNWVYLLTCDGRDVDPLYVEPDFLEQFIEAVNSEINFK